MVRVMNRSRTRSSSSPTPAEQGNEALRTPPHSVEAESSVLGAMMLSEEALAKGMELLREEDFYVEAHRKIFRAIVTLGQSQQRVDAVTVMEQLKREGELESVGGAVYLANLVDSILSPALFEEHARIVLEKSLYRKALSVAYEILDEAYRQTQPADDLLDHAEYKLSQIRDRRVRGGLESLEQVLQEVFPTIQERMRDRRYITGLPSGLADLDRMTSGFQRGDLVVIASRPSMGKTAFILNIHRHLSVDRGIPTAFFSLEMAKEQIALRLLCMEARVDFQKVRTGYLNREEIRRVTQAVERLRTAPIFIDDTPGITIPELRAKARRAVREHRVALVGLDYLQLMRGPREAENRQQEIAAISRALKSLAKELNIPVLAVSQLSRAIEQRKDPRPQLSDLRESGAIEQDSDVVLFLHSETYYSRSREEGEEGAPPESEAMEIIIGKQRNGPVGTVKVTFLRRSLRFENYIPEEVPGPAARTERERPEPPEDELPLPTL